MWRLRGSPHYPHPHPPPLHSILLSPQRGGAMGFPAGIRSPLRQCQLPCPSSSCFVFLSLPESLKTREKKTGGETQPHTCVLRTRPLSFWKSVSGHELYEDAVSFGSNCWTRTIQCSALLSNTRVFPVLLHNLIVICFNDGNNSLTLYTVFYLIISHLSKSWVTSM